MYVGTIHGFALEILQLYLAPCLKFDVLTEVQQRLLVDCYYDQCGMRLLELERWAESSPYVAILRVLREANLDPGIVQTVPAGKALGVCEDSLKWRAYLDFDEIQMVAAVELDTNQ